MHDLMGARWRSLTLGKVDQIAENIQTFVALRIDGRLFATGQIVVVTCTI